MRLPEAARSTADGVGPVWTRAKKKRGNPFFRVLVGLVALIGLVVLVLAGIDRSFAKAGARIDGWICAVIQQATGAKAKAATMDQAQSVKPTFAPTSSKTQAAPAPAAKP